MRRSALLVACIAATLTFGASRASAATVQLVVPQSTAFSFLGASCGGIQEQVTATGFDTATGYPAGVAYLSTRCGGSGRGGGYHTTTYSASVVALWDFTGAVVSAATGSAAGGPLPAYDQHGNELYDAGTSAYLVLAPGFVPAPRLTAITPTSGPAAGGTTVTITGTGFAGVTGVAFGGIAARSFTVTSSTSISAVSPTAAAGTVDVTVANAGGVSAALAADRFTFVGAPAVTSIAPTRGTTAGGTTVTINGTNLDGATSVRFGGTAAGFVVDSGTSITVTAPAAEAAGTVDVTVTTRGGTSTRTSADRFTYVAAPPAIGVVDPASGPADGGTTVTIYGSSFTGATAVAFAGVRAQFSVVNSGTITTVSPPGTGTVDITVTTRAGTSAVDPVDEFAYLSAPSVDAIAPDAGPTVGGTLILLTGSGFAGAQEVDVGGVATQFAVQDDGTLYALTPGGAAGAVDVSVTTSAGTSAPVTFTYVDPPVVSGVAPGLGAAGDVVTVTGSGFTDATEVDFGTAAAAFTVVDDGTITATVPAGDPGPVDVTVSGPGGTSGVVPEDAFTYG